MANKRKNNYDSVAGYYDVLSRLVFGRSEINAQVELLRYVFSGDRLLVVGGGTGWVLEEIGRICPAGLRIVYVESSGKMMNKARKRNCGENAVEFVCLPVEDWVNGGAAERRGVDAAVGGDAGVRGDADATWEVDAVAGREANESIREGFDVILTGFFFDNFSEENAGGILRSLDSVLKKGGYWLNADFYCPSKSGRWWHRLLLQSMYVATRVLCRVEADRLPDMATLFAAAGYSVVTVSYHYQRFIQAVAYRK